MNWQKKVLVVSLFCSLAIAGTQAGALTAAAQPAASSPPVVVRPAPVQPGPVYPVPVQPAPVKRFNTAQLDQLVAPIALYPDALVAQVLAASAYPVEIVDAEQWMQQRPDLRGDPLAQEVDKESWDPSVKALTQFPSVLDNMSRNIAWTSSLGDAYVTQQPDVLDAVQAMRRRARAAGSLKSTPQQIVTTEGQAIVIDPADLQTVYVPQYDPWLAYGAPLGVYPGYEPVPGLWAVGPDVTFGLGLGIGLLGGVGWGWHHWGADWRDHRLEHDHAAYVHHSSAFGFRGASLSRPAVVRGFSASQGLHTGAFSGVDHGVVTRGYSFRGQSSFGGGRLGGGVQAGGLHEGGVREGGFQGGGGFHGGGFHGGGGGFHGGGGHR